MKIILPFRRYVTISVFLLFSLIAFSVQGQNCMDCMESTQTLQSCDTNGDGDAGFDLDDDIAVSNAGNTFEFYTGCSGSGTLTGQITGGGTINNYQVTETTTIYARELSGPGGSDTCVQIVEVTLVPLIVDITPINGTACADSPLTLTANVNGVSGSASYQWKRNGNNIGSNSSTFDATLDGTYTVEVTDFGCTSESTNDVTLTGPTFTGEITASSGGICSGGPSVTLTATPNTGDPDTDYSYVWSTPGGSNPTSRSIVTTTAGNFSVTITEDASGCGITEGPFNLADESITFTMLEGTDPACLGGSDGEIEIRVSGGSGDNYTFSVEGESNQTGNDPKTFSGLEAGTYGVTVTDNEGGGCSVTGSVTLDPGRALTMTLTGNDPTTLGGSNGSIGVSMMNGMTNYEWDWDKTDAPTDSGSGSSGDPGFSIMGLAAGDYTVTVVDKSNTGCTVIDNITLNDLVCTVGISNPNPSSPTCNGGDDGSITVSISNPIGMYVVKWSGTETGQSVMTSGATHTIMDLSAGTYSITVEDSAECEADVSNVTISNTPPFTFNTSLLRGACDGASNGEIRVNNFSNGTTPYMITWNGPVSGGFSTSSSSYDITGLPEGTYTINVDDGNDCTNSAQQVIVTPLPDVDVDILGDFVFCAGDGNTILSTSPSNFSDYDWSTGSGSATISVSNPGPNNSTVYSVTVTDDAGCTGSNQAQVSGLAPISITLNSGASKTSVTCNSSTDGRIDINISGGSGTYSYSWSGPNGFSASTADIDNLGPGDYNLSVMDNENCVGNFSQNISVPTAITAAAIPTEVTCNGDTDGMISVTAQGGTGQLSYDWSSPIPPSNNSSTASNLAAGTYSVTIEDINGCFVVETATVTEPNEVVATILPGNPEVCIGDQITLTAGGGTSYAWGGGQGSNQSITVSPSTNTTYNVTVTDAATKNCTDVESIEVVVNPLPVIAIDIVESSGISNNDFITCENDEIRLIASGGTSYTWTGGNSNPYKFTPPVGTSTYTVTVTDNNDCINTETTEILVNLNPIADFEFNATQIVGDPQNIINESQALCGELVECNWEVENVGSLSDCEGISPTWNTQGGKDIKLTVENSCGCVDSQSKVIEIGSSDQCAIIEFTINNGETTACVGQLVDLVNEARPSGDGCALGTAAFEVKRGGVTMMNGNQYSFMSNALTFNEEGTYDVTYTINDGACGCTKSATRSVNVVSSPDISFAVDNPTQGCEGQTLQISFADYDSEDKIRVQFDDGSIFNYENPTFEYTPTSLGENKLRILSVDIGTCGVPINGEELIIDILPEFKKVSEVETDCDEDLRFKYTLVVEGGDPNASLMVDGIEGGTFLDGNTFEIDGLEPNTDYNFSISRGNTCDAIPISIKKIQCNCTFDVGDNTSLGFEGCEDEVFDVSNIFSTADSEFDSATDTVVYVLHLSGGGLSLGKVFKILPFSATALDNDFIGFTPNFPYSLSAVGLKKASLEDGEINLGDPDNLSFLGENDCLSVVNGIPVVWRPIPNPELQTLDGTNEICRNAYDFPVFIRSGQDGVDFSFEVLGQSSENVRFYGFQDTAFIYFEDNGQDSFQIVAKAIASYTNADGESFTCEGSDTTTLYVKDGPGAPPLSDIIYWPGNILASTADSSTTCFEWGFYRGSTEVFFTDEATSKFFYAPNDADIFNGGDIYFVDTYFCDNPDCVTRVFFNSDGPIPGLAYKEEETFQYLIKPNPNDGNFILDLYSRVEGTFLIEMLDATGKRVYLDEKEVFLNRNDIEMSMQDLTKGIYFIRIYDKTNGNYSTDKVIIK